MRRLAIFALLTVFLLSALGPTALALEVCYPASIIQSDDGSEIRKTYDLGPEDDPGGIPRSDFEQNGWSYSLTDLLKQETPEYQEREYTETVTVTSKKKDTESVLALLPQEKEFVTDDGLSGVLALQLSTVRIEEAGYGTSTKTVTATRRYPNLAGQDTEYIPKTIDEGGRTMKLKDISWQTENTSSVDGYAIGDRYTAVATYTGTATSTYVTGYNVTADYTGTVSRIALDRIRYVAIFERVNYIPDILLDEPDEPDPVGEWDIPSEPDEPDPIPEPEPVRSTPGFQIKWAYILVPLGIIAAAGGGIGLALFLKRRSENGEEDSP